MKPEASERFQDLRVGDVTLTPGTKSVHRIPVLTDLDGAAIELVVHAVVGTRPGPVLAMHTALHGSEWLAVEITRRVVEGLNPEDLSVHSSPCPWPIPSHSQPRLGTLSMNSTARI